MYNPEPVYLFLGPEIGQKTDEIIKIRKSFQTQSGVSPEIHKFYPYDTSIGEVISLMLNGSLFSNYKFVTFMNIEELKKESIAELISYIKSPGIECTLFLVSEKNSVDKKITTAIPKKNVRIFWELFENQKKSWISSYLKKEQIEITDDAIDMILEMVENNTNDMRNACSKLSIFFGINSRIEEEDIENFIYHSKEENVFTLFKKIASADFSSSIEILHKIALSGEGTPVQLISGLQWQFRKLLTLSQLFSKQYSREEALSKAQIRGKRNQQTYIDGLRNYSTQELQKIIVLIAKYDILARELNKDNHLILMELFIYYCVTKKGNLPEAYKS
ncbi:MAG: DNA polymerase III subunit delta [Spirochaetia bacterium]|jgi:DNA polymerase-3 subunit delta|nr:DNA polymerase III subunit delta [Spirochaetia bacterium]